MPHKALLPFLLILFTLSIETHAAGKAKAKGPAKSQTFCEFALKDRAIDEYEYDEIFSSAYLSLGALDEEGLKKARIDKDITDKALLEFFEIQNLDKVKSQKLNARTLFTDSQNSVVPEIEVYIPGSTPDYDQVLSIVSGHYDNTVLYWKKLDLNSNAINDTIPESAEIGLTSPIMNESNVRRRFISVKEGPLLANVTVGIDVPCNKLSEFTKKPLVAAKIITAYGNYCRVPVFRIRILLKKMDSGGGSIANIRI